MNQRPKLLLKKKTRDDLPRCRECGDVIASGTYGAIFASSRSPMEVVKGSLRRAGQLGCPEDFKNEYRMSRLVEHVLRIFQSCPWYQSPNRPWAGKPLLQTAHAQDFHVQEGACFFFMSRIFPLEGQTRLSELTPGYEQDRSSRGVADDAQGGCNKMGWRSTATLLHSLFHIGLSDWGELLGRFVGLCHRLGIILNDVEFIVGRLSEQHPPSIFLVDFDKCYIGSPQGCAHTNIQSIERLTLHQFPTEEPSFKEAYAKTVCPRGGLVDKCSPILTLTAEAVQVILEQVDAEMQCSRGSESCARR